MSPRRIVFTLVFIGISYHAVSQGWKELYQTSQNSYSQGDLGQALTSGTQCLETYIRESGETNDNYTSILRLLENICYADGKFEKGLEYAAKEVSLREGKRDVAYAGALSQRGMFEQALFQYDEADQSFAAALGILKEFYQPSDIAVVEAELSVGINAYLSGDDPKAFSIFDQYLTKTSETTSVTIQAHFYFATICLEHGNISKALESFLLVKQYDEHEQLSDSPEYASVLANTGRCYYQNHLWDEAEKSYAQAQAVYEKIDLKEEDYLKLLNARAINFQRMGKPEKADGLIASLPSGQSQGRVLAVFLNNKAALSQSAGDYKKAEATYREALGKLDKSNKQHTDVYIETLQNLATLYTDEGNLQEAARLLEESELLLKSLFGQQSIRVVPTTIKKANVLLRAGQVAEARQLFKSSLQIIRQNKKTYSAEWVMAANGTGAALQQQGDVLSADSVFADMLRKYNEGAIAKDVNYPAVLNNYAAVNQAQGQFLTAHSLFRESADYIRQENGAWNISYATALENLAYVDLRMGLLQNAKSEIDSALMIYEKLLGTNSAEYASALLNLGRYHQHAGEYPLAEPCFKRAYTLIQNTNGAQHPEMIHAINELALFYQTMGNYEEAEPLFKEAQRTIEKTLGTGSSEYSTSLQNLATLYQMQGRLELASPMLEQALKIDEKIFGVNHPQYAVALKNLAAVYQKAGKLDNAQTLLERALQVTQNVFGTDHPSYAVTISNLAALYQDRGDFNRAAKAWEQSVSLRKKLLGEQHPDYARSLYGLATIHFAQGNFKQANQYYKTVVGNYLTQIRENFPSLSEKEKGAFYQKIKPVFDTYQDFCIQFYKQQPNDPEARQVIEQLYNVQLLTKAILLNASNKVRQSILASNDTALVNAYHQWLKTKEQIVRYYTLSNEERKQFESVTKLQQRANDLEKSLSVSSSLFRAQFSEQEITAQHVRRALQPGEAAVEIIRIRRKFKADSVYYAGLILRRESELPSVVIWPHGAGLENRAYKYHRNAIKFTLPDTLSYKRYWKPLGDQLTGVTNIYLSCDGIFNKVNVNTLLNGKTNRWVLDDHSIKLVSNTKEIAGNTEGAPVGKGMIDLYGYIDFNLKMTASQPVILASNSLTRNFGFDGDIPVLPATEKEVDDIRQLLLSGQWKVASYKKAEASEVNIKKTVSPAILHIATHGFFLNDIEMNGLESEAEENFFSNPLLRSGLLLAGAGVKKAGTDITSDEDGILTAYEAMNLTLDHTDLVVLSACETGLGEVRNGEGVYGLQRSFLVAGANAVLMSLWQVDDVATQELMVEFYKHWMQGESKLEAFRKAQLVIKEKYTSPYYWGAFIMVGY